MDAVTRRRFLIASGVSGGLALAGGATVITMKDVLASASADPRPADASVLVLVTLYGGNDGLNTVIPASDPAYRTNRPNLSYREDEVLPLADGLGLNPSMKGFKSLWDASHLAIVRGVSYPVPDHSHFRSMAIWQSASPGSSVTSGWLGRWLDGNGADPLKAIAIGSTLPPMLAGAKTAGAALPVRWAPLPARLGKPVAGLGHPDGSGADPLARAAGSISDMLRVDSTYGPVVRSGGAAHTANAPARHPGELAAQLDVVSRCIKAGAPARAYSVSLGGFDTHAEEKGTQSALLGQLDSAVSGFLSGITGTPLGRKVVVAVYSEFGRRVAANLNQGTDHGTSGPVFIAGDPVRGGFYGDEPSLTRLTDGDLAVTTDFRDVYATLLARVLGSDPAPILGGARTELDFC